MINKLINAAGSLDEKGFKREADYLDGIIRKLAEGEAAVNKKTDTWIAVHDPVYDSKGKVPGWLRNETLRTLIEDAVSNRPEVGRLRLQLLDRSGLMPAFKRINEERKNKGLSSISPSTNAVEFAGQIKGWVIVPYVKDLEGKGGRSQPGLRLVLYDPNGVRKAAPIYYGESGSKTGIVQSKVARLFKHLK